MDPVYAKALLTGTPAQSKAVLIKFGEALQASLKEQGIKIIAASAEREGQTPSLFSDKKRSIMQSDATAPTIFGGKKKDTSGIGEDMYKPLTKAIIQQESGGKADAVSGAGAVGLMQLLPSTAKQIAQEMGMENIDLKDPEINVQLGERYLEKLIAQFDGDIELALTAYHSGPGRVERLLKESGGTSLADIKDQLGPIGQRYAADVLKRLKA
jgi:soluble lytic murein transglycosylase